MQKLIYAITEKRRSICQNSDFMRNKEKQPSDLKVKKIKILTISFQFS